MERERRIACLHIKHKSSMQQSWNLLWTSAVAQQFAQCRLLIQLSHLVISSLCQLSITHTEHAVSAEQHDNLEMTHLPQAALLSACSNGRVFISSCRFLFFFCSQFDRRGAKRCSRWDTQILIIYCKLKQHFILIFPFKLAFFFFLQVY